MKWIDYY